MKHTALGIAEYISAIQLAYMSYRIFIKLSNDNAGSEHSEGFIKRAIKQKNKCSQLKCELSEYIQKCSKNEIDEISNSISIRI